MRGPLATAEGDDGVSMMMDMMESMPKDSMAGMDMSAMQECVEACSAAATAATMCADACMGHDMGRCAAMCTNMADVATTTMRMMMRPSGYDMTAMQSMMSACVAMGEACAAECQMHAEMHGHCRICANACMAMVEACKRAMASMPMS
jgi:hypothetical protein